MATKIQLRQFCALFGFPDRQVRYFLEQGLLPPGVAEHPSTGNRREFGPRQAFWLSVAVLLKSNGMKATAAAEVAEMTTNVLGSTAQNFGWDPEFHPSLGWFETEHQYYLDVGDLTYVRWATTANPSKEQLYEAPWQSVRPRRLAPKCAPWVILRVDLTKISRVLAQVDWGNSSRTEKGRAAADK